MEGDNAVYRGDDPWTTTEYLPMQMVGGAKLVQGQLGNAIRVILHNVYRHTDVVTGKVTLCEYTKHAVLPHVWFW